MTTRVRFAPSPTGYLHIGAARAALFNYLYAKRVGGKFLLRIEDTDLQRSTEESTRSILDGLKWLELEPEEEIVVMCHHGIRSANVCMFLARNGFEKVFNLDGGIDSWSLEVDENTPRY